CAAGAPHVGTEGAPFFFVKLKTTKDAKNANSRFSKFKNQNSNLYIVQHYCGQESLLKAADRCTTLDHALVH
ncbi:MAG: hypothetical protein L0228_18275, partial [Planctomycetes bacterium]|nr:hypothetical protein [Planctomycetota bacterium]